MGVFEEDVPMEQRVLDIIESKQEYKELIQMIVGWEEENQNRYNNYDWAQAYTDTAWKVSDLPGSINPGKLGYLKRQGIIDKVRDSNNNNLETLWALIDREGAEEALRIDTSGEVNSVSHDNIEDDEIPDDIFETIVGHEDIKTLFKTSINTEEPVHILLVGPPACGKTVFLEEVSRLPRSEYMVGSSTTGPGFLDELFDKRPLNILIDEFDKMGKDDYGNLLSLQESGMVKETKGNNKRREIKLDGATVFASANRVDKIPDENISRFMGDPVIKLPKYDDEEFREVTLNVLDMREKVDSEVAQTIADIVVDDTNIRDFRECRRLSRLVASDTEEETVEEKVRKYIDIIDQYGSNGLI